MAIFTAIASGIGALVSGLSAIVGAIGSLGVLGQLALGAALSIAANFLLGGQRRVPAFNNPAPQYQAVINQSTAPRRRGYGRAKLGGVRAFFDSQSGQLWQVIMLHQGRLDAFEALFMGDTVVTTGSDGMVEQSPWSTFGPPTATVFFDTIAEMEGDLDHPAGTIASVTGQEEILDEEDEVIQEFEAPSGPYIKLGASGTGSWDDAPDILISSLARIYTQDGQDGQAAFAPMVSAWTQWTADHRLRGIAYLVARFDSPAAEEYLRIFPEGYNTPVMAVCRMSRVLDTRTSVTAWSDNPALCLADYLTHPDGYRRLSYDDLDTASFNSMANLCDEAVSLAGGGTEKRYRCSGVYELNDSPTEIVQRILATCDGELYTNREGKLAIRGGKWTEPTVTIEPEHILAHEIEEGADALDRFNQLKIVYTDPSQDFQPTEAAAWDDLADQAERGLQSQDFSVDMCPSPSQARRLAKITIAKSNPRWRGSIRTNLAGLKARGERTIRLVLPELQIDQSFLVLSHNLMLEGGMPIGCEMQVLSMDGSAYHWDPATEEGQSPAPPQDTSPDPSLAVPQNIVLTQETRSGSRVVVATCDPADRPDAQLEGQIRLESLTVWEAMSVASGSLEAVSGPLNPEDYLVRLRFRFGGAVGPWSPSEPITVTSS